MTFAGVHDAEDRADVILYLRTLADSPAPLPEAPAGRAGRQARRSGEQQGAATGGR